MSNPSKAVLALQDQLQHHRPDQSPAVIAECAELVDELQREPEGPLARGLQRLAKYFISWDPPEKIADFILATVPDSPGEGSLRTRLERLIPEDDRLPPDVLANLHVLRTRRWNAVREMGHEAFSDLCASVPVEVAELLDYNLLHVILKTYETIPDGVAWVLKKIAHRIMEWSGFDDIEERFRVAQIIGGPEGEEIMRGLLADPVFVFNLNGRIDADHVLPVGEWIRLLLTPKTWQRRLAILVESPRFRSFVAEDPSALVQFVRSLNGMDLCHLCQALAGYPKILRAAGQGREQEILANVTDYDSFEDPVAALTAFVAFEEDDCFLRSTVEACVLDVFVQKRRAAVQRLIVHPWLVEKATAGEWLHHLARGRGAASLPVEDPLPRLNGLCAADGAVLLPQLRDAVLDELGSTMPSPASDLLFDGLQYKLLLDLDRVLERRGVEHAVRVAVRWSLPAEWPSRPNLEVGLESGGFSPTDRAAILDAVNDEISPAVFREALLVLLRTRVPAWNEGLPRIGAARVFDRILSQWSEHPQAVARAIRGVLGEHYTTLGPDAVRGLMFALSQLREPLGTRVTDLLTAIAKDPAVPEHVRQSAIKQRGAFSQDSLPMQRDLPPARRVRDAGHVLRETQARRSSM